MNYTELNTQIFVWNAPGIASCSQNTINPATYLPTYPHIAYVSGLTIYDEALIDGRWVGRYWSANGFIESERNLLGIKEDVHRIDSSGYHSIRMDIDIHAFGLEVDGQSLHFGWEFVDARIQNLPNNIKFGVVELKSTIRPVQVRIYTEVDGTGFLKRWLEITNTGEKPAALNVCWPWSGMLMRVKNWHDLMKDESPVFSVGYMSGHIETGDEGAFTWQPLPSAPLRLEARTGRSGRKIPFFIVRNEATGEHMAGGLEWSGNWAIELMCEQQFLPNALLAFRAGPVNPGPLRIIAPGETVTSPKVHLGEKFTGFDGIVQAWHDHLRKSVLCPQPKKRGHLVVYNQGLWSYHGDEPSEERNLKFDIDIAAEIGAEVFVHDAAWYGDKGAWWFDVEDWTCGTRLPNGLEPIFDYARKKNLLCGLWMQPELIGPKSRIIKEHPEWLMKNYGKETGRGDIDLTNPEAQKWVESKITGLIERYRLDLFRLDYNADSCEGGQTSRDGYMENSQWRYYEFIYGLYDRLKQKFPNLILENCSSGGERLDLGMVKHFHQNWISDCHRAPRSVKIVNGVSIALPPEIMVWVFGVGEDGHVRADVDFQIRLTILSVPCITPFCPNKNERNEQHVQRIKHAVSIYKDFIRPFLPSCKVYHHTPVLKGREPGGWCILEYVAEDFKRAVVGIFRLAGPDQPTYLLRLRGVHPGMNYRITFDNMGHQSRCYGQDLMRDGLLIRLDRPLSSEFLLIEHDED